jgi:hypothetical protein
MVARRIRIERSSKTEDESETSSLLSKSDVEE